MKYLSWIGLLLLLSACQRPPAATPIAQPDTGTPDARTHVGNGGDDNRLRDNAWFARAKPIQVCLESEPELENAARTAVKTAFSIWQRYFEQKSFYDPARYPERASLPGRFQLTSNYEWRDCAHAELRIVVGETKDARLNWERLNDFPEQSAFEIPLDYDPLTGSGRGDVWVASPDRLKKEWQSQAATQLWLVGHLIHELGHVFGCGHVPGTLMAQEFVEGLEHAIQKLAAHRAPYAELAYLALWPDQQRELLTCRDCALETKRGYLNTTWDAFDFVFGDRVVEEIPLVYDLSLVRHAVGEPMQLHFKAARPAGFDQEVPLEELHLDQTTYGDIPIFKVTYRREPNAPLQTVNSFQTSLLYSAVIRPVTGGRTTLQLRISRNLPPAALVVQMSEGREAWLVSSRVGLPRPEEKQP